MRMTKRTEESINSIIRRLNEVAAGVEKDLRYDLSEVASRLIQIVMLSRIRERRGYEDYEE